MKYFIQILLLSSFFLSCETEKRTESENENAGLKFSSKEYEAALEAYNKDVKNNPSSIAYSGRAFTNLRLSKITNAVADFDKALEMNPKNPDALAGKSFVFMYQEEFAEAAKYAGLAIVEESDYKFSLDQTINKMDLLYIQAFSEYLQGNYSICYDYLKVADISLPFEKSVTNIPIRLLAPLKRLLDSTK